MPPVAADCAAGDVLGVSVGDYFVDVGVTLQHGNYVCMLEDFENFGGVRNGHRVVFAAG